MKNFYHLLICSFIVILVQACVNPNGVKRTLGQMERNEAISEANALLSKCNNDWVKGVEVLDVAIFHDTLEVLMKHRGVTDFVSGVNSSRV
jgi:hypothetical protein